MDANYVLTIGATILGGFGLTTYFAKRMVASFTQDIKEIKADGKVVRNDIHAIRLQLSEQYMKKDEVKDMIREVKKDFLDVLKVFLSVDAGQDAS